MLTVCTQLGKVEYTASTLEAKKDIVQLSNQLGES